jgi:type II secretory pathway pseudopilin PulG
MSRCYAQILVAVLLIGGAASAAAQSTTNETPQQNVKASQQYQQLTCTNKAFRSNRIAKECGPLQGSSFYDTCVASFNCDSQPSGANWRQAPPSETMK